MALEIKILAQILALWQGRVYDFYGQKTCFLVFSRIILLLFSNDLGIFLTYITLRAILIFRFLINCMTVSETSKK